MAGKIFINYRREDTRSDAARIRDRLVTVFGKSNVFMDVDNLMAGQRFDQELAKALDDCDVLLAVIGARWHDIFDARARAGGRDYVREEIAEALKRGIVVIPVLVERTPLPSAERLPVDIRPLVLHQKHDVGHERFGRDVDELAQAIKSALLRTGRRDLSWQRLAAGLAAVALFGLGSSYAYKTLFGIDPTAAVVSKAEAPAIIVADPAAVAPPSNAQAEQPAPIKQPSSQDSANSSPEPDRTAAVERSPSAAQPAPEPQAITTSPDALANLTSKIQSALRQAGCFAAEPTGKWGPKTTAAAARFNKYAGRQIETDAPAEVTLAIIGSVANICPPECKAYEELKGTLCVEKSCPAETVLYFNGSCYGAHTPSAPKCRELPCGPVHGR